MMSKNLKFFCLAFLLSLPFWWLANVLQERAEDFLFWKIMADNPHILLAQMAQEENLAQLKPIRRKGSGDNLELGANGAFSVLVHNDGSEKILFEKNSQEILPIASITKLMTAFVVLEYYDISDRETVELLYSMIIASNNRSAKILAEIMGEEAFVRLMNLEAKNLGLANTYFVNSTGLDSEEEGAAINRSTARDLAKFAQYITIKHPLIWEISAFSAFEDSVNTNDLLTEFPEIIGGKTGWTKAARGCLILVVNAPNGRGHIINVVLGSPNRSKDMKELINWTDSAYVW